MWLLTPVELKEQQSSYKQYFILTIYVKHNADEKDVVFTCSHSN